MSFVREVEMVVMSKCGGDEGSEAGASRVHEAGVMTRARGWWPWGGKVRDREGARRFMARVPSRVSCSSVIVMLASCFVS